MDHKDILNSMLFNASVIARKENYSIITFDLGKYGSTAWLIVRFVPKKEERAEYKILSYKINNKDSALKDTLAIAKSLGINFKEY